MRVAVTGATGFIGGAVARRLLTQGHAVVAVARRASRAAALERAGAEVAQVDLADDRTRGAAERIDAALNGCHAVVHCAGLPRTASRRRFQLVHVEGTRRTVAAAVRAGTRRFVNIATQAVVFDGHAIENGDESLPYPHRFIDPYSRTKAEAERAVLAAAGADAGGGALGVISLRPAVVWGRGDTTILPILTRLAMGPGIPQVGHGRHLEATTHIENLVDAVMLAVQADNDSPALGRAWFIVDDFGVTWKELMSATVTAAGVRPRFRRIPRWIAGPAAWTMDTAASALGLPVPLAYFAYRMAITGRSYRITGAQQRLGYRPRVGWAQGLEDLDDWVHSLGGPRELMKLA